MATMIVTEQASDDYPPWGEKRKAAAGISFQSYQALKP